jgi:hypothetical protein
MAEDLSRATLPMQDAATGAVLNAESSITNSRGKNLLIEATALSAMSWLLIIPDETLTQTTLAVQYISINMVGGGRYGTTQGTMLSLQLLIDYFHENGSKIVQGEIELTAGSNLVQSVALADHAGYVIDYSEDLSTYIDDNYPGAALAGQSLDLTLSIVDLPPSPNKYSIGASYYARYWDRDPPDVTSSAIALTVDRTPATLEGASSVGDLQTVEIVLENTSGQGQGMSIVQLAIPSCMSVDFNQLEILKEDEKVNSFELTPSNDWLYLYFTYLQAGAAKDVTVTLVRQFEGQCKQQKTLAYLYYDEEARVLV